MEPRQVKKVAIPANYLVVHFIAVVVFAIGALVLFSRLRMTLINAVPWLAQPAIAWTLLIVGLILLFGNQVRLVMHVQRLRRRA